MANSISFSRYVDITSGIGAGANVGQRNLGGVIITESNLCPTGTLLSFTSAQAVGAYFGTSSGEYARAVFYFGWVSKNITSPQTLSFWFWNADVATDSLIFGAQGPYSLSTFTAISAGQIILTMGGFTHTLTGINLSAAADLATVAADIQTAVRAFSGGGAAWTGATVTYNPAGSGSFNLVSGAAGVDTISVAAGPANDIAGPLGWLSANTVLSNGTAAQTVTANLTQLNNTNNNFGSFCFGPVVSNPPTLQNIEDAANWNKSLNPNIQYLFSFRITAANAVAWIAAMIGIGGCTPTLAPLTTEYPEMVPMIVLAATNYVARNSVQNYMFQIFNLTPSVTNDADADTYDNLRINYYGQTQVNGQILRFYQRGFMLGLPVDPSDQNVYGNEIWLKSTMAAQIFTLLLALSQVPANASGRAQLLAIVQGVITQALFNGTISVGKTLTTTQQLFITNATGDPQAWQQVQNIGYWVDVEIVQFVQSGVTQYKAVYTLIYSKDDVIRLVQGTDILI